MQFLMGANTARYLKYIETANKNNIWDSSMNSPISSHSRFKPGWPSIVTPPQSSMALIVASDVPTGTMINGGDFLNGLCGMAQVS